nr:protein SUPPRESSOR OF npr1-1, CONSTITUTIVE 1-like [Quercus suber]XP_023891572.1 protein SUPPRESSOR OF npr1-1, CONSTITUTIVE 1-like [Quercus suber]
MSGCENLIEIDKSVGDLDKLETWNLRNCSKLKILPSGPKLRSLKYFRLSHCGRLEKFPAICAPNLESLEMNDCKNLIEVHESVGDLDKLKSWNLESCIKLEILPSRLQLRSLQTLFLRDCRRLEKFPAICAPNLELLEMTDCKNLIEVHESVGDLDKLRWWTLNGCIKLEILPSRLQLRSLESLELENCGRLEKFPAICAPNLYALDISFCKNLIEVHESVGDLDKLIYWTLDSCIKLEILPSRLQLRSLQTLFLRDCRRLEKFPAICAPNLELLEMTDCKNLIEVHESVGDLDKLRWWTLNGCIKLEILPSRLQLRSLESLELENCGRLEKFPAICAPNLYALDISFCKNLIEVHESVGDLDKLIYWTLDSCIKLEILPSRLQLRSLQTLFLRDCRRLEKFPDIHPEMKYLRGLFVNNSGIREWPSSFTHLTKGLRAFPLSNKENLWNFLHSRNKLQLLEEIDIPTANSFDGFSRYRFLSLTQLWLHSWDGDITELDFQYFPLLSYLTICDSTIISIPQSISGFARLESIHIENCKRLREIPTLPQSVREVFVKECPSVDPQSFSRLLIQFGEILGILPNRFHEGARSNISMDPFHDSESESEDEDKIPRELRLPVTEIPKDLKFSHQTFGNSLSFWVGKKFSKAVICIAFRMSEAHMYDDYAVDISVNGCFRHCLYKNWTEEELWLFPIWLGQLDKRSEQNHITVEVKYDSDSEGYSRFELEYGTDLIKWMGVNLECSCYPQNSDVTCLPLPCAMNGCGSSSIPNDTELPPFLPFSSTSYASDSDHRVLNNGRNYVLAGTGLQKRRRICL